MNAVFFNEELHARAPNVIGSLFSEDDGQWIGLADVVQALRNGEAVSMRPATATEACRAEALVGTFEIGCQLSKNIQTLFENKGPDVVEDAIFNLHQAVMGIDFADVALIDKA